MKIILVTDYFYPSSSGGTEKYVYVLGTYLAQQNVVRILSSAIGLIKDNYNGLEIDYLSPNTDKRKKVLQGSHGPDNLVEFKQYIEKHHPDVVHFHTLTPNFNHHHLEICFKSGIKTFFTSHTPDHQCSRGDFIYRGEKPCDGKVEINKCTACICLSSNNTLFRKLVKYVYYQAIPLNPIYLKLQQLKHLENNTHKIVAVCSWQKDFFIKNGIAESHLTICRQAADKVSTNKSKSNKIKLGFIGRIDKVKGLHMLIDALNLIDKGKYSLKIAAVKPNLQNDAYFKSIKEKSKEIDCKWVYNLDSEGITSFLNEIDYLIVPSLWLETGPFVIYEALAANTPVVTTNMGGQKELIIDNLNGFLFEPNMNSLLTVLKNLSKEFKIKNDHTRETEDIGREMLEIYINT